MSRSQPNFPSTNYIGWSKNGEKVIHSHTPAFSILEWSRMPFTFKKRGRPPSKSYHSYHVVSGKTCAFDPFCTYRMRRARCPDMVTPSQMVKNMNLKYVHKQSVVAGFYLIWCKHKDPQRLYWQRPVFASNHSFETSLAPFARALLYEKCSNPTKYWYHKSFFLIQFSWSIFFYPIRFLSSFVLNLGRFSGCFKLTFFCASSISVHGLHVSNQ